MARRLARITEMLTANWPVQSYHFHGGASGAYVCHDPNCKSPALDSRDS